MTPAKTATSPLTFDEIARLAAANDNVAIATRHLEAGMTVERNGTTFAFDTTVMVGHRFAIEPIATGAPLLSWGLPFGVATRPIAPGEYVRNAGMIEALNQRALDYNLPQQPNFRDRIIAHDLDETRFTPGRQVERYAEERTFLGYPAPAAGAWARAT